MDAKSGYPVFGHTHVNSGNTMRMTPVFSEPFLKGQGNVSMRGNLFFLIASSRSVTVSLNIDYFIASYEWLVSY